MFVEGHQSPGNKMLKIRFKRPKIVLKKLELKEIDIQKDEETPGIDHILKQHDNSPIIKVIQSQNSQVSSLVHSNNKR